MNIKATWWQKIAVKYWNKSRKVKGFFQGNNNLTKNNWFTKSKASNQARKAKSLAKRSNNGLLTCAKIKQQQQKQLEHIKATMHNYQQQNDSVFNQKYLRHQKAELKITNALRLTELKTNYFQNMIDNCQQNDKKLNKLEWQMAQKNNQALFKTNEIARKLRNHQAKIMILSNLVNKERNFTKKIKFRKKINKINQEIKAIKHKVGKQARILKKDSEMSQEAIFNANKRLEFTKKNYDRLTNKLAQETIKTNEAIANIKEYYYQQTTDDKLMMWAIQNCQQKNQKLQAVKQKLVTKLAKLQIIYDNMLITKSELAIDLDFYQTTLVWQKNNDTSDNDYDSKNAIKLEKQLSKYQQLITAITNKINKQNQIIIKNKEQLEQYHNQISANEALIVHYDQHFKNLINQDKNFITNQNALNSYQKTKQDYQTWNKMYHNSYYFYQRKVATDNLINAKIELTAALADLKSAEISAAESKILHSFAVLEKILLHDWFFVPITALLCSGVVLATYLYITTGVGALNEIFVVKMLDSALKNGDTAILGFGFAFLAARVLEGPLVGILDIGGSILTGVGMGATATLLLSKQTAFIMHNPLLAICFGAALGMVIGLVVMIIRTLKPKSLHALGTDIMIGAGNQTGKFLGPLVILSAAMYNPITGIGAALGAGLFLYLKKPVVGGAILGSLILSIIPVFLL